MDDLIELGGGFGVPSGGVDFSEKNIWPQAQGKSDPCSKRAGRVSVGGVFVVELVDPLMWMWRLCW